jgi:predicted N-acyltransferase
MNEVKIYTTKDIKWNDLVDKTERKDIYFTSSYMKIYEESYGKEIDYDFCGKGFLFFYGNEENYIIIPLIKRSLKELNITKELKEEYFDVISPYGYTGLLSKGKITEEMRKKFWIELKEYCLKNKIVSGFIRFHPLIENHTLISKEDTVTKMNQTVYVNLEKDEKEIWKELNKKTRNQIRKAKKNKIEIKKENKIESFTKIYEETMEKNNASKKYFFPKEFFENHIKELKNQVTIFTANYKNEIVSTSMFIHKGNFLHYHFSGSKRKYLNLYPNNLLLWEVIKWGKKQGFKKFHLGGGTDSDPKNPLFRFKSGFSPLTKYFYTKNEIFDHKTYKKLCELKEKEEKQNNQDINKDFFPRYRA